MILAFFAIGHVFIIEDERLILILIIASKALNLCKKCLYLNLFLCLLLVCIILYHHRVDSPSMYSNSTIFLYGIQVYHSTFICISTLLSLSQSGSYRIFLCHFVFAEFYLSFFLNNSCLLNLLVIHFVLGVIFFFFLDGGFESFNTLTFPDVGLFLLQL